MAKSSTNDQIRDVTQTLNDGFEFYLSNIDFNKSDDKKLGKYGQLWCEKIQNDKNAFPSIHQIFQGLSMHKFQVLKPKGVLTDRKGAENPDYNEVFFYLRDLLPKNERYEPMKI